MMRTGENSGTRRKTCPSVTCLPQIPHGLAWDRLRAPEKFCSPKRFKNPVRTAQ